jgi:hypothetical protein
MALLAAMLDEPSADPATGTRRRPSVDLVCACRTAGA